MGTAVHSDVSCRQWGLTAGVKAWKKILALLPSHPKTLVDPGSGNSGGQYLYGLLSCTLHLTCCSPRKQLMYTQNTEGLLENSPRPQCPSPGAGRQWGRRGESYLWRGEEVKLEAGVGLGFKHQDVQGSNALPTPFHQARLGWGVLQGV